MTNCPCGSGKSLDACCGPYLDGRPAPTPEALMRSRYTAFVKGDLDYIERTHSTAANSDFDRAELERTAASVKWVGLEILDAQGGGPEDDTGTVEFVARYRAGTDEQVHHELSTFVRENGAWAYADGIFNPKPPQRTVAKVGRNDPCPCGSGKKYKKCCGA